MNGHEARDQARAPGHGSSRTINVISEKNINSATELAELNGYEVKLGVIYVSEKGNVILRFDGSRGSSMCVEAGQLIERSTYFRGLLDPSRGFAEAQKLAVGGQRPTDALPAIDLEFPSDESLTDPAELNVVRLAHFLSMLHGNCSLVAPEAQKTNDMFFLGLCWDRFLVNESLKVTPAVGQTGKTKPRRKFYQAASFDWTPWNLHHETECRKLIYANHRLGLRIYLAVLTQKLIVMGSKMHNQWLGEPGSEEFDGIIWHLPAALEEEILIRRRTILGALAATIDGYVAQYSSSSLQCRFGYGNSHACDIFQLGQMLRFFNRKQITELKSTSTFLGNTTVGLMYDGSIMALIKSLRAIPDTQIDSNHQHCGVRKDLIPLLDTFEATISRDRCIGICGNCWANGDRGHQWAESEVPPVTAQACPDHVAHMKGKAIFAPGLEAAVSDLDLGL